MKQYNIYVTNKVGVHDPAGRATSEALADMAFEKVIDLRIGKLIKMQCMDDVSLDEVAEMCEKLLVNPVMEDYQIEEVLG
ncbi:MAG: phosphoribosylformylglycinamidine synthase subunit PurS [Coriobacteriia bacterium]|nr:phosphoribosylformylglycinamidine synthase subunit PurS [Coriobacteriia bacterium]